MGQTLNCFRRYAYGLEKHDRGCINWSWVGGGRDRLRRTDLYDVVAEEHHLEEEGDDHMEEDDWDHEYPVDARVRLLGLLVRCYQR